MTHPDREDPVIARSVLLRERLVSAADRLVDVTSQLLADVLELRGEVAGFGEGDDVDDSGT